MNNSTNLGALLIFFFKSKIYKSLMRMFTGLIAPLDKRERVQCWETKRCGGEVLRREGLVVWFGKSLPGTWLRSQ